MKDLPPLYGRVLSVLVVWTVALSAFMALVGMQPTAKASICSQSTWPAGSDWTVTGTDVCQGTMYTATGSLIINPGASLTLKDGGIQFAQTTTQHYSVTVSGALILDNAVVTVTGDTIDPYLKLVFQVSGRLEMKNGAVLAFPGWFTANGATVIMSHSTIKALDSVAGWTNNVDEDDDAPAMAFDASVVRIYDSTLQDLFEKAGVNDPRRQVNLTGSTHFIAIGSYIGIDLANATSSGPTHNTLDVTAPAQAFLLWPTFDDTQKPANSIDYSNAINVTGATAAYVYRRANVTVVDQNGAPVDQATLRMTYSGTATDAQYPDRSVGAIMPHDDVLAYLGRNAGNWKTTNPAGQATIPLVSDRVDTTGVHFWGNYNITATSGAHSATKQVGLAHYPVVDDASNSVAVILELTDLVQPLADLRPDSMSYTPLNPTNKTPVTINITVANDGLGRAKDVDIRVYDNVVSPAALINEEIVPLIDLTSTVNLQPFVWLPPGQGGTHSIIVVMDPQNTVAETNEGNNQNSFPLPVTPLGPDLETVVPTLTGFAGNPVNLDVTINNVGDTNAPAGIIVNFYIDSESTLVGTNTTSQEILPGGSVQVSFAWVPPSDGIYTVIAIADPGNLIPENLPYLKTNNKGTNTLTVVPAPNLISYTDDLGASDPFPTWGTSISLYAIVRNIGQANVAGNFDVSFYVDGVQVGTAVATAGLGVGDKRLVTSNAQWTPTTYGYHTLKVHVDSADVIPEGSFYEQDNSVTRTLQVFRESPAPITYSGTHVLTYLPVTQNIIISGHVTIIDGSIVVTEPQEARGRVFIKVTGTLTLINSTITARDGDNWPVVLYVSGTGKVEAWGGSSIFLNTNQGDGVFEVGGNGVVELTDTTVKADVSVHGASVFFNRVTFQGKRLHVDTAGLTKIWDPIMDGMNYIALRSDDGNVATSEIDLRNATLDQVLTSQLVFGGHQYAHITNVTTTKMTRWWEGTITQKAKVTRFWWLAVEAVDGTGAFLRPESNTNISLYRLNMISLRSESLPNPTPGVDIFGTNSTSWPVNAPQGMILYKAPSEDRFASVQAQYMNATYTASGNATINGTRYVPDQDITLLLDSDLTFRLTFSRLTPDLSVQSISFSGDNGGINQQPINRALTVTATIRNTGEIGVPVVWVNFYYQDVDTNGDGLMDLTNASYGPTYIGRQRISVPLSGTAPAVVAWDKPEGAFELTYVISVVVDPPVGTPDDGGLIKETNEFNNIGKTQLNLYTWPDLHIEASQVHIPTAIQGNPLTITVDVTNIGTNDGTDVRVELRIDGSPTASDISDPFRVNRGGIATTSLQWIPPSTGSHDLMFTATISGGMRNIDYNPVDNSVTMQVYVASPPDLAIVRTDFADHYDMTQRGHVLVPVKIYNYGDTGATGFSVGIYYMRAGVWPPGSSDRLSQTANLNLSAQSNSTIEMQINSIPAIEANGTYQFTVWVDSTMVIGEVSEANNAVNVTLNVLLPVGYFDLSTTPAGLKFKPGAMFTVVGQVKTVAAGEPIPNLPIDMTMRKEGDVQTVLSASTNGDFGGAFLFVDALIPSTASDGTYDIEFTSQQGIQPLTIKITVESVKEWTIFGLPWWMFILIIIVIVVVIVGVIAYTKKVGLGKLVECGECGAFIPEDSVKCPKCGVEFEKDMAKCSNCQAWIPLDVKQCPECNVEFATGEVEMADYEQKMRVQYDEVKKKFREQAQAEIGKPLSDEEFESWWKKQPSFLTFEDWLRDEEEMRKMGSKPCPSCGTLNSVNATVCHKCGTLMKKEEPKKRPPPKEEKKEPARVEQAPQAAEPRPVEPVPKKVVVKKPVTPMVIQKKVVIRKPEESQEGAAEDAGTSSEEEI
jgi:subtilase family serine protease/ribosomal protein L40E